MTTVRRAGEGRRWCGLLICFSLAMWPGHAAMVRDAFRSRLARGPWSGAITGTSAEVRAKVSDGYGARVMVLSSGNRIFMLGVHSKHGTERLYDALVTSFFMH